MGGMRTLWLVCLAGVVLGCASRSVGPVESVKSFERRTPPIARSGVATDEGGWRVERPAPGSVPLFEVPGQKLENTVLTYRAHMRASDVAGKAYLEMWIRVPGRGEFFSRGLAQPLQGTSGLGHVRDPVLPERGRRHRRPREAERRVRGRRRHGLDQGRRAAPGRARELGVQIPKGDSVPLLHAAKPRGASSPARWRSAARFARGESLFWLAKPAAARAYAGAAPARGPASPRRAR
jgi:hypothetical protein